MRQMRRSVGLSQEQLADMVGTSQPTLSAYEHDHKAPSVDTLNRIAVSCGYFLVARAGARSIACPLPATGWFEDEDLPPPDALEDQLAVAERKGRMRHDAPRGRRAELVYELLGLAESQRSVRRR